MPNRTDSIVTLAGIGLLIFLAAPEVEAEGVDGGSEPDGDGSPADGQGESALALAGHIVVEREGDVLRVMEMYVLMVGETIPPSDGEPWISLPEGARALEVGQGDEALVAAPGGIVLTEPLERGRRPIAFSFEVAAPQGRATLAHSMPFAVEGLHLVWQADAPLSARAMGFQDTGTVDVRGRVMRVLERTTPIARGERLAIVTSGRAAPRPTHHEPTTEDPLGVLRFATIALAGIIVVAGLLLPWRRRLRRGPRSGGRADR